MHSSIDVTRKAKAIPSQSSNEKGERNEKILFLLSVCFAIMTSSLLTVGIVKSTMSNLSLNIVTSPTPMSYLFSAITFTKKG